MSPQEVPFSPCVGFLAVLSWPGTADLPGSGIKIVIVKCVGDEMKKPSSWLQHGLPELTCLPSLLEFDGKERRRL